MVGMTFSWVHDCDGMDAERSDPLTGWNVWMM